MDESYAIFCPLGRLDGHNGWVTSIIAGNGQNKEEGSDLLISGSRDKSIIVWNLKNVENTEGNENETYGVPDKLLTGHNHFISDLSLSSDNGYLLSSSWDKTIRLWDLKTFRTNRLFTGHTKEVFSVAFSSDNRQIISSGADKTIKLWNTLAECKFTSESSNHSDWVSCIRYSPVKTISSKDNIQPYFTSVGWDGKLKVWNTNFQIRYSFRAHEGNINSASVSPNRRYIATGGKDKYIYIWDLINLSDPIRSFESETTVNQIAFNPHYQLVCAATESGIKVWDILAKEQKYHIKDLYHEVETSKSDKTKKTRKISCTSVAWDTLGNRLFAGFADGVIKAWDVKMGNKPTDEKK